MHITVVVGTRPEAIKMAPVVLALRAAAREAGDISVLLCSTGQHGDILRESLDVFGLTEDINLEIMKPNQDLTDVTSNAMLALRGVLTKLQTDLVLVHGDTTTAMAAALASYYHKIPVGHVEAGLRSGNKLSPWPEEINRSVIGRIADLHFAPTEKAAQSLRGEGIDPAQIIVTGNTVVDALQLMTSRIEVEPELGGRFAEKFDFLDPDKRMILVTAHRRENFGVGIRNICAAIAELGARGDVQVVYPVHPNPNIRGPVGDLLSCAPGVHLVAPSGYLEFIWLMSRTTLILTDSGGLQEEAPSLGKPVLVMRDTTERPEAIEAGTARLVGTDTETILREANLLLDDPEAYRHMAEVKNPFGDGHAAPHILAAIRAWNTGGTPEDASTAR